jgi:hypothetical protein
MNNSQITFCRQVLKEELAANVDIAVKLGNEMGEG